MASGNSLRAKNPYRGFHLGFPGSGKTGALVSLLNAGYKLRVLDFEGNFDPLINFADEKALGNLDVVTFQDRLYSDPNKKFIEPLGIPSAFVNALKMMKEWKYKDEAGVEVDLGKSSEWGQDTIVVVDSLTSLGTTVLRRSMKMNGKDPSTMTSAVWGAAVSDLKNFIQMLKDESNKFHLIINCHKQMIGPKDMLVQGNDDNAKMVNETVVEMNNDDLIPVRFYPVGITKPSSQTVHGELPIMLEFKKERRQGKDTRIIDTVGSSIVDVKIPVPGLKKEYPIETGLAEIFAVMGYKPPGFAG